MLPEANSRSADPTGDAKSRASIQTDVRRL